ncbi:MAG: ABC transporter permease [Gemmatimonadaceae bacterium]|nr:ABC transporter permease [Gemmatimonadaceae bacterium]
MSAAAPAPRVRHADRAALGVLAGLVLAALLAPWLAPHGPTDQLDIVGLASQPPSARFWLGTDAVSRDVLSRVLHGARVSLAVGAFGTLVALVLGAGIGLVAGWSGGRTDALLMGLVDTGLAVPRVLLVLAVVAVTGGLGTGGLVLLLGATGWFGIARLVRGQVRSLRTRAFVEAARTMGAPVPWIVRHHLLPHLATPLLVAATLGMGQMMLLEAGVSFLGVGVRPPAASWGNMIADGRATLATAPWVSLFPGLAIVGSVLALTVISEGMRRRLDPRETA